MRIRVVGQAGESLFPFNDSGPWAKFRDSLITRKDVLVTQKFGQKIDALICNGYSKNAISEAKNSKIPKNRMILILWEPPVVHPKLHSDEYLSNFGYIYVPSKEWAKKFNSIYFKWPIGDFKSKLKMSNYKHRENSAVMIQANKINFFKGENYSLRRISLYKSLKLKHPIKLYGTDWDKTPIKETFKAFMYFLLNFKIGLSINAIKYTSREYPHYEGISKNKFSTLEKYKYSIVIENHNSYVSEKIFDSLNSHCITIYVGPNLVDYGLNENIAIQSDPDHKSILENLEKVMNLSDSKIIKLHNIQRYHLQKVKAKWNNELVLSNLAKDIRNKINK
jgi:hypothetical protein